MKDLQQPLKISIGGDIIAVEGPDVAFFAQNEAFTRFAASEGQASLTVRYGCSVDKVPDNATLLSSFLYEETNSRCIFSRLGDDYYYSMLSAADGSRLLTMRYRRGASVVESTSAANIDTLRFSLWFAVGLLVTPSMLTFVHSSTIVHHGRAVLFLGESGTGKSTHSRLWLKHIEGSHLLNDDSPLIRVCSRDENNGSPKRIMVYGSPWSGKTPCYVPLSFPLAAIVRLSQAPYNVIRRQSIPEAFAALQPSLPPALVQDDCYADYIVDIISDTIARVPVYHLECLPDAEAARLCYKTVFSSRNV